MKNLQEHRHNDEYSFFREDGPVNIEMFGWLRVMQIIMEAQNSNASFDLGVCCITWVEIFSD